MSDTSNAPRPYHVVFVIFDEVMQLDFSAPAQFLERLPNAIIHTAVKDMHPIRTECGFHILPSTSFADCPQADLICIPGGLGIRNVIQDREILRFLCDQSAGAQYITSVCTGALALGAAGLLVGKRATTHWAYTSLLQRFGAIAEHSRVVNDGNLFTCAGVTSGIDLALSIIGEIAGRSYAESVQLSLEYDPHPPFSSGHPDQADPALLRALLDGEYGEAIAGLEDIIRSR